MSLEKILVVDDNKNICDLLKLYLTKEGYRVVVAYDGEEALVKFNSLKPDLILLDVMLPVMDGWQTCLEIRKTSNIPIIMLTAKGEVFDRVLGLEIGADDYISKPFDAKEKIKYDKLEIDMVKYEMKLDGKIVDMPPKELELLFKLASNPNQVCTRDQLLDDIWGYEYYGDSRTIDVHIKRIRTKIDNVSDKWKLRTVWGVGYKFELNEN